MMTAPGQPQMVPPQPVPTLVQVGQVDTGNGMMVMLQFSTPTGMAVFFLEPPAARQVGEQLARVGQTSKLLLAGPGAIQ